LKYITYEIFEHSWRNEIFDAKILNISIGGICVISEDVQEPEIFLNLLPHSYGTELYKQAPCLAQVRWISPVWEKSKKASFKIGLQFLTKSLYRKILEY
jgi:hypothetical protein